MYRKRPHLTYFTVKRVILALFIINVLYLCINWLRADSHQQHSSISHYNYKIPTANDTDNLLFNHNFANNSAGWRQLGRYNNIGYIPTNSDEHPYHVVPIYPSHDLPWNGLFQPVDLRNHTWFIAAGYYELRLSVDYINLDLKGNLNLKMTATTKDFAPMDPYDYGNVFSVPNTNSGNQLTHLSEGRNPSEIRSFLEDHKNNLGAIISHASLVMYSRRPLNYVTCYIYTELTGVVLITNTSLTIKHVQHKQLPSVSLNQHRFSDDKRAKISQKIGNEFKLSMDRRKVVPFHRRSSNPFNPKTDTTMTAQLDITRFARLMECNKQWDGPTSVVIYVVNPKEDIDRLDSLIADKLNAKALANVDIHLAYKMAGEMYPINELRNLAIELSTTEYIFTIDVDFVVSPLLNEHIKQHLQSYNYPTDIFFIVPAFELDGYSMNNTSIFPKDKSVMLKYLREKKARSILDIVYQEAHGPTDVARWMEESNTYQTTYNYHWEPFGVVHRSALAYDEKFSGYGWDKVSNIYYLHVLSFKFMVLPEGYMIHMEHQSSTWNKRTDAELMRVFHNWFESITEFTFKYLPHCFSPLEMKCVSSLTSDEQYNVWSE